VALESQGSDRGRYVEKLWEPRLGAYGGRRSIRGFTYRAFLPDPIAELEASLPLEVAGVNSEAEAEILALQQFRLEGMDAIARLLLRGESLASSRIEGLQVSQRRLAEALFEPSTADETAKAVIGNVAAMDQAIRLAAEGGAVTEQQVKDIHAALLRFTQDAAIAGRYRDRPGWLGGTEDNPARAEYVPPPHEEIPALMDDLVRFLNRTDMPPLVQAAIAHAQFELVHPFGDGNGRVGRCLVHLVLRRRGLATTFVSPISIVLATDTKAYVRGLEGYRANDVPGWCGLFAAAARQSARLGSALVTEFNKLEQKWILMAGNPRAHSTARAVLRMLPSRPVVDAKSVAETLRVSEVAARNALTALAEAGILRPTRPAKWRRAWAAREVFDLMNLFEKTVAEGGAGDRKRQAPAATGRLDVDLGSS